MSFLELAKKRRSIRRYKPDSVPDEIINEILESARLAPSGNNTQPWRFIIVKDAAIKYKLYESSKRQKFMLEAPIIIALLADITCRVKQVNSVDIPENIVVLRKVIRDTAIAGEHIALAATDLGLGSCWNADFEQEDIKPILNVPEFCFVVALFAIGYPAEDPKPRRRKPLKEIIYYNKFN
ncbi:MAG: nitroreductase family protein [Deltaproteobacteria bacterium]|nr:nitroreductase family protein [Deltaproteobacteria bacterium]